jgi:hypothetical protein
MSVIGSRRQRLDQLRVLEKNGPLLTCRVIDGGMPQQRHVNLRPR